MRAIVLLGVVAVVMSFTTDSSLGMILTELKTHTIPNNMFCRETVFQVPSENDCTIKCLIAREFDSCTASRAVLNESSTPLNSLERTCECGRPMCLDIGLTDHHIEILVTSKCQRMDHGKDSNSAAKTVSCITTWPFFYYYFIGNWGQS